MKKILSPFLSLILAAGLLSVPAAAETDLSTYAIANGTVQAAVFDDITAPYSGTVLPFDWEAGDSVTAGAPLFEMMTADVTAPEDGTIRHLFAEAGDSADAAMATYGAVLAMEPAAGQRINATTKGAANFEENKHPHVGDILYFKLNSKKGTGTVIAVNGSSYVVEITSGKFDSGKQVDLYRAAGYGSNDKTGTGKIVTRSDVTVAAAGRIAEVLAAPGDEVKKGDVLLRVMTADAGSGTSPVVTAPADGVVGVLGVSSGQQVWKGQLLCRLLRTDSPEIVAQVDEMDLRGLRVGDRLPVTLDTDESRILTGTVTEISALGVTRQNAAYYTVHLSVPGAAMMLGQSASVYLPKS